MSRCIFSAAAIAVAVLTSAVAHAQSSSDVQSIFRFDTFGDEQLWTNTLRLQEALKTVSPRTALSVGLKVDSDALTQRLIDDIKAGRVNLDDPAVMIQLLRRNDVIGVITDTPRVERKTVPYTGVICGPAARLSTPSWSLPSTSAERSKVPASLMASGDAPNSGPPTGASRSQYT